MKLSSDEKKIICDFFELFFTKLAPPVTDSVNPAKNDSKEPIQNRLIPVTQWNKFYDWPSVGGLRHLIYYENTNGFNKCVRRAGRRVLIDEKAFFEWISASRN